MNSQTIQRIQNAVQKVENVLQDFNPKDHANETYGNENEYTAKSLKDDIKAVLTDIRALVNAPDKFVRLYTYQERVNVARQLQGIRNNLNVTPLETVAQFLEPLKTILRPARALLAKEHGEVLTERADTLLAKCAELDELLPRISRAGEVADEVLGKSPKAQNAHAEIQSALEQVQQTCTEMEQLAAAAKNNEGAIREFFDAIEERRRELEQQKAQTEAYEAKLKGFAEQHVAKLAEAEGLIKQARDALGYTTASGISAAFTERHNEDKRKKSPKWWLGGAAVSAGLGIGIGLLWLFNCPWLSDAATDTGLAAILSRLGGVSIALSAAWFCASQYNKHRNTMEDYGYKAVLAKSMVAFLDQLEGADRQRYLELVLTQIHQDPLRKRHDENISPAQRVKAAVENRRTKGRETKDTDGP